MTQGASRTILLVEDNPGDILLARKAFECTRIKSVIDVAVDGEQALDYLHRRGEFADRADGPDLVLLDINLPKLSGIEVLKTVKADPALRRIPVAMLTSSDRDVDVYSAYDSHANSYVTKPSNVTRLIELFDALQDYWFGTVAQCPDAVR